MTQINSPETINLLAATLQRRYEPNFVWGNMVSMYLSIPHLRAFWPLSSVDENTDAYDISGQGRMLTNDAATYGLFGLCPMASFTPNAYLYRADEPGLSLFPTGLTFGGWFRFHSKVGEIGLMSKWAAAGNQRSYRLYKENIPGLMRAEVSYDGTIIQSAVVPSPAVNTWSFCLARFWPLYAGGTDLLTVITSTTHFLLTGTGVIGPGTVYDGTADFTIAQTDGSFFNGDAALCFIADYPLPDYYIKALFEHTRALFGM